MIFFWLILVSMIIGTIVALLVFFFGISAKTKKGQTKPADLKSKIFISVLTFLVVSVVVFIFLFLFFIASPGPLWSLGNFFTRL